MNLDHYLKDSKTSRTDFASAIGVSPGLVYQWLTKRRPVSPPKCVLIEKHTQGKVQRRDLRPDDWQLIWPELDTAAA